MSREETREVLFAILKEQFGDAANGVSEESTADDVEGWDSLQHVVLLGEIEKRFAVKFSFEDLISFENVGKIVDCLVRKSN